MPQWRHLLTKQLEEFLTHAIIMSGADCDGLGGLIIMFISLLSVSSFMQDVRTVVAIQVFVFSVVLLTATGMVIDFGRADAALSKLQGIADQLDASNNTSFWDVWGCFLTGS